MAASQPSAAFRAARLKTLEIRGRAGVGRFADARLEAQELIAATGEGPVDVHFRRDVEHIRIGARPGYDDSAPQLDLHVAGFGPQAA